MNEPPAPDYTSDTHMADRGASHLTVVGSDGPPNADIRAYYQPLTVRSIGPPVPLSMSPPTRYTSPTTNVAWRGRINL